jgi:hypothetical protein
LPFVLKIEATEYIAPGILFFWHLKLNLTNISTVAMASTPAKELKSNAMTPEKTSTSNEDESQEGITGKY